MLKKYDHVVIKFKGNKIMYGQCYDGLTGIIIQILSDEDYRIKLDEKSKRKVWDGWSFEPIIETKYIFKIGSLKIE